MLVTPTKVISISQFSFALAIFFLDHGYFLITYFLLFKSDLIGRFRYKFRRNRLHQPFFRYNYDESAINPSKFGQFQLFRRNSVGFSVGFNNFGRIFFNPTVFFTISKSILDRFCQLFFLRSFPPTIYQHNEFFALPSYSEVEHPSSIHRYYLFWHHLPPHSSDIGESFGEASPYLIL